MTKRTIKLERSYPGSIEDAWELWTTKDGLESWWGPDGFSVEVFALDLRPSGQLHYAMTATAPPQIEFMKNAGMPLSSKHRVTYKEVARHQRLAFVGVADFIPGVAPYETNTSVEFARVANGIRIEVTLEPMHDEVWTQRMAAGWESQLGRLEKVIANRGTGS